MSKLESFNASSARIQKKVENMLCFYGNKVKGNSGKIFNPRVCIDLIDARNFVKKAAKKGEQYCGDFKDAHFSPNFTKKGLDVTNTCLPEKEFQKLKAFFTD